MKTLVCFLTIMALVFANCAIADDFKRNYTPNGLDIPASQWETNTAAGVSYAVILSTETQYNKTYNVLVVYIKNISTSERGHADFGSDSGCRFFYTDSGGAEHDLHPRDMNETYKMTHIVLSPGQTIPFSVYVSPSDLLVVTSHPMQCEFGIMDATHKYNIITSPKTFSLPQ